MTRDTAGIKILSKIGRNIVSFPRALVNSSVDADIGTRFSRIEKDPGLLVISKPILKTVTYMPYRLIVVHHKILEPYLSYEIALPLPHRCSHAAIVLAKQPNITRKRNRATPGKPYVFIQSKNVAGVTLYDQRFSTTREIRW